MAARTWPCYVALSEEEWQARIEEARALLRSPCRVCPRYCKVDRTDRESKKVGFCRVKDMALVSSYGPHLGEEDPLRGTRGSGTIFLASCNLSCVFCQNWEISQARLGHEVTDQELATMMLDLQQRGCHNINFVSPSIYVPQIIRAAYYAARKGLRLPFVYNTGGYDSPESLRLLDGIIDIYMPDAKYSDDAAARRYSLVKDYWEVNRAALKEMQRQVGVLQIDERGLATRGVLVRHLVLPEGLAGTREVARFLARELSPDTYINVMAQYRPENKAAEYPPLARPVRAEEVAEALEIAHQEGLHRFDQRHPSVPRFIWLPR